MTIILDVVIFGHDNSTVRLAKNKSVSIVMIHISMILHTHSQVFAVKVVLFFFFNIFLASNIIAQQVEKF